MVVVEAVQALVETRSSNSDYPRRSFADARDPSETCTRRLNVAQRVVVFRQGSGLSIMEE